MELTKEEFEKVRDRMQEILDEDKYTQYLGIEIVDFEEKFIRARMKIREDLLNNFGSVHGGVLYSLADIVAGTVSCSCGKFSPTVEGHLNYLEPAISKEYLYCEAKRVRCGSHLVVVKIKIKDDKGKLLDDGSFTFYRTENNVIKEDK